MKTINILLIVLLLGLTLSCKAQERQEDIATEIIGAWIAEDDNKVELEFRTDGICLEYYDNQLVAGYNYSIADKCGEEEDVNSWFLKRVDQEDGSIQCYELYGANVENNNTLSMKSMSSGKIFVYNKN